MSGRTRENETSAAFGDTGQGNHIDEPLPGNNYKEPKAYTSVAARLKAWSANPTGPPP